MSMLSRAQAPALSPPSSISALAADALLAERRRVSRALLDAGLLRLSWLHADLEAELRARLRDGRVTLSEVLTWPGAGR